MAVYQLDEKIPDIENSAYVAEDATIIGWVTISQNASVWPQAVIRGDNDRINIGTGSNIQDGAVLHTDPGYPLHIGDHVTVGHQAMLHGCSVGHGSLIGIQAIILNGAVIGNNCLVGAGSIITSGKVYPDNSLIIGSPARVIRQLDEKTIIELHENAVHYIEKAKNFKSNLKRIG